MRKIIAALQVSLDGFIEGPNEEIDEIRLVVQPIVLGGGKPLFKDVKERHALTLLATRPLNKGAVSLSYSVPLR